jgi:RecG-like helicase
MGEDVIIRARLISAPRNFHKGKWTVTNARIADESGELAVVWFNQPYLIKNLVEGQLYLFKGKVKRNYNRIQLTSPQVQKAEENMPGIVSVYPLGGGLTQKMVQAAVTQALDYLTEENDPLPSSYRQNLMGWSEAVKAMHLPASFEEQEKARHRLVFDELSHVVVCSSVVAKKVGVVCVGAKFFCKRIYSIFLNFSIFVNPYRITKFNHCVRRAFVFIFDV